MVDKEEVIRIVDKHQNGLGHLISILEGIQIRYGYLPEEALRIVAEKTKTSVVEIFGVATFYRFFRLKPIGKYLVSVCLGTACHIRSSPQIIEEFERQLNIKAGETTADMEFSLEPVNCLGSCALGPMVVVNGHYFSNVTPSRVKQIIKKTREGLDKVDVDQDERIFPVEVSCPHCNHSLMDSKQLIDKHPSIKLTASFGEKHGWIRLSSLYGSPHMESEFEITSDSVVNFFCPHCNAPFIKAGNCPECDAPMVPMIVYGGGIVQICSRRGCRQHMLDLSSVNL
jgi:NADH-quinone oxidoreductase subunit E